MNIEPLKIIISLTTNKKNTILYFLSDELKNSLTDYELIENNDFYLNDKIICVKKYCSFCIRLYCHIITLLVFPIIFHFV